MADIKEKLAQIEKLAKENEEFRNDFFAAVTSKDIDVAISLINSKGFDLTAEDLEVLAEGQNLDDTELANVAGGKTGLEKLDEYCGNVAAYMCGMGLAVALWSPDYQDD